MILAALGYVSQLLVLCCWKQNTFLKALPSITFYQFSAPVSLAWLCILSFFVPLAVLAILLWDSQGQKLDCIKKTLSFHCRLMFLSCVLISFIDYIQDAMDIETRVPPGMKYVFHLMLAPLYYIDVAYHRASTEGRTTTLIPSVFYYIYVRMLAPWPILATLLCA